jgi:two-component system nitrogen regulation response regulator GlnG
MSRILVVDDEASICWALRESLGDEGHEVEVAASAEEGLRIAGSSPVDALVLDVRLPGADGLASMRAFQERTGGAPIIIITAFGNLDTAVSAMEGGAFDYLVKPFDLDVATSVVTRALEKQKNGDASRGAASATTDSETLLGASSAMQDLFKRIALVAPTNVPVLVTGESGTGKELVARAIHRHSRRRDGPFLPICLAALSPSLVEPELFGHLRGSFTGAVQDRKGLLELAKGGTVLLDEVGEIPPAIQVKLLRVLEHREVTPVGDARPRPTDIRLIAATNRPLSELMAAGQFREDLFFRLSVFQIHLPPLRERPEDIGVLAEHFLRQSHLEEVADASLTEDLLGALRARDWVGNIRELRNAIEHAAIVARGGSIRPEHLPPAMTRPEAPKEQRDLELQEQLSAWADVQARASAEKTGDSALYEHFLTLVEPPILRAVLRHSGKNRAAAAEMLGIHRATLRQKLRKYGIA